MPQRTCPRLLLTELQLDRGFSYLVLDDPCRAIEDNLANVIKANQCGRLTGVESPLEGLAT